MSKYLKSFEEHSEYATYISRDDRILPNVSLCEEENELHYNPFKPIIAKFNITDTSNPTAIIGSSTASYFNEITIDGVVLSSVVENYTFDTTGEHKVKYSLIDVTTIDNNAFNGCSNLVSVTIPSSVTSIGNSAFYGCSGLTSITIPSSITTIGQYAFRDCSGLTSITIPYSVTTIGHGAFVGCLNLISIEVESGNTNYDSRNNCNAIINTSTNVLIRGCRNTIIPNDVTEIGYAAFNSIRNMTSIIIPNNVITINTSAFNGCRELSSITMGNSVRTIGISSFNNCRSLTSIVLPSSLRIMSKQSFVSCVNLASITSLATTAPSIQNDTFQNVKANGTLTVPSGSTGYDVWMGNGNYYLGSYNWTKVEQ